MNAWASWAQVHQKSLGDPGEPLNMKKIVTAHRIEDFTDSKTGYAIVEARSHDEAVQIFAEHPTCGLCPGSPSECWSVHRCLDRQAERYAAGSLRCGHLHMPPRVKTITCRCAAAPRRCTLAP